MPDASARRAALQPLSGEEGEHELVDPLALPPAALQMMCLAPHPEMIEKRDYPAVPDVAIGSHTMLLALEEEVVEQPCDRFAR